MKLNKMAEIETYVRKTMTDPCAHNYGHAERVRNWAIKIAKRENYADLEAVEAAGLLHDIGRYFPEKGKDHGEIGALKAQEYLEGQAYFKKAQIEEITNAIRYHNKVRIGQGVLLEIIRDADMLDGFGAIGVMRALTSEYTRKEFDPDNVKSDTWGYSTNDFDKLFSQGKNSGKYIIDELNYQLSWRYNLNTKSAKEFALPLLEYMKGYIMQIEEEISIGRTH